MTRGLLKHGMKKAPGWGEVGDGIHTTTRYGELETDARKKSLGVFYRNWHPGPLGFQVVADAIAWRLASAGVEAADMLLSGETAVDDDAHPVPQASLGQGHCDNVEHGEQQNAPPLFHTEYVEQTLFLMVHVTILEWRLSSVFERFSFISSQRDVIACRVLQSTSEPSMLS